MLSCFHVCGMMCFVEYHIVLLLLLLLLLLLICLQNYNSSLVQWKFTFTIHRPPWSSAVIHALPLTPLSNVRILGLSGWERVAIWRDNSLVTRLTDLSQTDAPEEPWVEDWGAWGEARGTLDRSRPSEKSISSLNNSRLMSTWTGRPTSTDRFTIKETGKWVNEWTTNCRHQWLPDVLRNVLPKQRYLPGPVRKCVISTVSSDGRIPLWGSGTPGLVLIHLEEKSEVSGSSLCTRPAKKTRQRYLVQTLQCIHQEFYERLAILEWY